MIDANEHAEPASDTVTSEHNAPETQTKNSDNSGKKEYGGPKGLEPTRYGDWEKAGRCIDF